MPKAGKVKKGSKNEKDREKKAIHPYSRKAKQIAKRIHHFNKIETSRNTRVARLEIVAEKLRWFQDHIDGRESYTEEELTDLVLEYRNRFEEELEQINIVQNVGKRHAQSRQHASREAAIKMTKEDEKNHFQGCGMEVPDLITPLNLEFLRNWRGELNLIQNIKMIKATARGVTGVDFSKSRQKENVDNKISDDENEESENDGDSTTE